MGAQTQLQGGGYRCGYNNYYFPYSTCISSFFASSIPVFCSFLKWFFVLVYVIFVKYIANVAQRTFEIVQKWRSANNIIINYIDN